MSLDGSGIVNLAPYPLILNTEHTLYAPSWGGVSTAVVINPASKRAANIEDTSWGQIKQRFAPSSSSENNSQ